MLRTRVGGRLSGPIAILVLAIAVLGPGLASAALVLGQVDTFEGGTTAGWTNGGAPDPVVLTGGPAGAADHFLRVNADGSGSGGKLITFNDTQWVGNYVSAGVTGIAMDLKNLGSSQLSMRVALKQTTDKDAPGYVTTTPYLLPADSAWHHAVFALDSLSLSAVNSPPPLATFLTNPAEMRILHATTVTIDHGNNITSQVGIDNITAVPEPATLALLGVGALGLLAFTFVGTVKPHLSRPLA